MQLFYEILNPTALKSFILFLHGLNTKTKDIIANFEMMAKELPDTQIILLQAPKQDVVIYKPVQVTAWYRFKVDETVVYEERESMDESRRKILELIDELKIPKERLIISGFSQGGAMALYTALTHSEKFMAVIGMCTYLSSHLFYQEVYDQKVIMISAKNDEVFSLEFIRFLVSFYNRFFGNIIFMEMDGDHTMNTLILRDIYKHCLEENKNSIRLNNVAV
ncbi:Lysophospholipase [Trachipleistophora hominis]|uniref:Acyl-protein thioesterase 1 n=1 Tax=Trachipleistophora hominis TaxID=72359 RepID=L7JSR7_TRAHO|nr:Lysophospholipase [Trachipleistophora hominis]